MSEAAGTAVRTRLLAWEVNATQRPSWLMIGEKLAPFAGAPPSPELTRVVRRVTRSRRNTSKVWSVSAGTRLAAVESNATNRPSPLTEGRVLSPFPCSPALLRLTRSVRSAARSRTNTSSARLVSPATRFVATESNATTVPFALTAGRLDRPLIPFDSPNAPTLIRTVRDGGTTEPDAAGPVASVAASVPAPTVAAAAAPR